LEETEEPLSFEVKEIYLVQRKEFEPFRVVEVFSFCLLAELGRNSFTRLYLWDHQRNTHNHALAPVSIATSSSVMLTCLSVLGSPGSTGTPEENEQIGRTVVVAGFPKVCFVECWVRYLD
jgi:hypothetical protein